MKSITVFRTFGMVWICGLGILAAWGGWTRAGDWPQLFGPARNGLSTETGLVKSWPAEGPPLLWQRAVGAGYSGPVVAGDRLILFHRLGDEEVVECLQASTGKAEWNFRCPTAYQDDLGKGDGPRATPLVSGERVYTLGAEGKLHCLDLKDGKKIWDRDLNTDYQVRKGFFGVGTTPLLEGRRLLVNVGGTGAGIIALDADNGKEVWRATDHEASYSSPVAATLAGRRQAIFFTREGIVFLDPQTGAVQFSKHFRSRGNASVNAASPVVAGDYVFFSACYGTGAILLQATSTGFNEVWKNTESMLNHYNTCVAHDGYLYGFDGRQEEGAHLRCIELKTSIIAWTAPEAGCGSMILADGKLIVLTEHGELLLVELTPAAYREKARAAVLGQPCRSPMALANGRLYARDPDKLVCWNLRK
jgi:outer membrane protein assembly factor BamB